MDTTLEPEDIPADWPVRPIPTMPGQETTTIDPATCGNCGLTWDDAVITSMTPAPSGRCPFESFHQEVDYQEPICINCGTPVERDEDGELVHSEECPEDSLCWSGIKGPQVLEN